MKLAAALLIGGTCFAADLTATLSRAEPQVEFIVLDIPTRAVLAERWEDSSKPIPVGSLVKPFLAMAWNGAYPEFECKGAAGACWRAQPHGHLRFPQALAESCNAYFLQFAAKVNATALQVTAREFGIAAPPRETPEARIGLGDSWRISPLALIKAYAELVARRGDPRVDPILTGLGLAAKSGTARELGPGVLGKTGTAECVAQRKHAGDGFAVALAPADAPRYAVLVHQHEVPGAQAAKAAARLLAIVRR